jgi:TonB family protein
LSIVFDARKNAEHSRRVRKAVEGGLPLPDGEPHSSDPQNSVSVSSEGADGDLLGLRVERRSMDWSLRWNRNAAVNATRGRLSITDGTSHKQLDLDSNELRNGSVVYSPLTNDVLVRLEIMYAESANPRGESLRFISGAPLQTGMPSTLPTERAGAARIARCDGIWPTNTCTTEHAISRQAPIVRSLLRVRSAERGGSTFDSPTLILRKDPVYPAIAKENLISGSVDVRFRVSPEGKVYDVKLAKGSPVLAGAATEAVKTWRYEPARLNGSPIDSQASAVFDFTPNETNARSASEEPVAKQEDTQHV